MQKFHFISHSKGVSKAGKPYDMCNLSTGLEAFPVFNVGNKEVSDFFATLKHGDEIYCDVELSVAYGAIRGTIVKASLKAK